MMRLQQFVGLVFGLCVALAWSVTAADEPPRERKASWLGTRIATDGSRLDDADMIFDYEILKAIQASLGGRYQNLEIAVSACYSGGFVEPAITKMLGDANWSIAAAAEIEKQENFGISNKEKLQDGDPAGLPFKRIYFHGWGPQWIKKLSDSPNATAEELADFAVANQFTDPQVPKSAKQFAFKGAGNQAKIRDGTTDSRMVFWQSGLDIALNGRPHVGFSLKSYLTFADRGYSDDKIDFALEDFTDNINRDPPTPEVKPDRFASKDALFKQIANLGNQFPAAAEPKHKALFWIRAHGNRKIIKAELQNDAAPALAMQGRIFDAVNASTALSLTPDMVATFFEGHGVDDPLLDSYGRPTFSLATSFESPDADLIEVFINGVPVGPLDLLGSSQGGYYQIALNDSVLGSLRLSDSFANNGFMANVTFGVPAGSFRVATDWDFDLGLTQHWGVGLTGPALATIIVPEPQTLLLFGIGLFATWYYSTIMRTVRVRPVAAMQVFSIHSSVKLQSTPASPASTSSSTTRPY